MITYGCSIQGKSHIRKGVVCQDSHIIEELKNGYCLLAVADGVGSAKHSDVGSQIATQTIAQYCMRCVVADIDETQLLKVLKNAYEIAFRQIETYCQNRDGKIEDYDTTLTVAIYTGTEVYFGHAGDGGIIIKDSAGKYEMITTPQKGEDGISVRPLRAGNDSWEFGIVHKKVAGVLLATDGMLDTLLPPLLSIKQMQENPMVKDKQMNVYVTLAEFFLNYACVFKNAKISNPKQYIQDFLNGDLTNEQFNQSLYNGYTSSFGVEIAVAICNAIQQYNYCTWKIEKVDDDKTIVCAINDNIRAVAKEVEYYAEPDWKVLQQQFERLAYPSLYEMNEDGLLENNGYIKLTLKTDSVQPFLHSEGEEASVRLKVENSTDNNTSVTPVEQEKVQDDYQHNKKKGSIVNIVCVLTVIALATIAVIVGIKVTKGTENVDEELAAELSTQVLLEKIEIHSKQEHVEEEKPEIEMENEVTIENKNLDEDKLSTEKDIEDVTFVKKETTIGNVSDEELALIDAEVEIVLADERYEFPCMLDVLRQKFTLEEMEDGTECNRYRVNVDSNVEIRIETFLEEERTAVEGSVPESKTSSENMIEQQNKKVKSISIALKDNSVGMKLDESTTNGLISMWCYKSSIAELGMSEQKFEESKQYIEQKTGTSWETETRAFVVEYRMEYQGITYIVCVEEGRVTELSLQLKDMR